MNNDEMCRGRRILLLIAVVTFLMFGAVTAASHPGRTASDGCHYCRINCTRWNVPANERHCHGGSSSGSSATTTAASEPAACPAPIGTWRGLVVAPECRCTPYDSDDYRYPPERRA